MFLKLRIVFLISFIVLFYNCKSTVSVAEIAQLEKVISDKKFKIIANSARPVAFANTRGLENLLPPGSNTAFINLVNNYNFIKIKKDSIFISMPYFGEVRIMGGYNSEVGFNFEGISTEISTNFNASKNNYFSVYDVKLKNESLRISITMYANKNCIFTINSSNRSTITYDGIWSVLEE